MCTSTTSEYLKFYLLNVKFSIFISLRKIIEEIQEGFFSIFNHFFVVVAELMEKFLICGYCSTPIGFPHAVTCECESNSNKANEMNFMWRKNKVDDKFITFGMQFSFNEIIMPSNRKDILNMISSTCAKQNLKNSNRFEKVSFPPASKSWPSRWIRGGCKFKQSGSSTSRHGINKFAYPVQIVHPPIFNPSVWTPSTKDAEQLQNNYEIVSFAYLPPQ